MRVVVPLLHTSKVPDMVGVGLGLIPTEMEAVPVQPEKSVTVTLYPPELTVICGVPTCPLLHEYSAMPGVAVREAVPLPQMLAGPLMLTAGADTALTDTVAVAVQPAKSVTVTVYVPP